MGINMDKIKEELLNLDQFKVEVDLVGLKQMHSNLTEWMNKVEASIVAKAAELGIEDFNKNSTPHKVQLFKALGIKCDKSAAKSVYEPYIKKIKTIEMFSLLMKAENIRRNLDGNAKGENSFYDLLTEENGRSIFHPEMIMTDGRLYQNRIYAMPLPMRKFIKPYTGGIFHYFDLSAAELTLVAHMSGNAKLLMECTSGQFWARWYARLGVTSELKTDIKTSIYACIYSLKDYAIPRSIGKRFYKMFFETYPGLETWLQNRVKSATKTQQNESLYGQVHHYDLSEKNVEFKMLNHPLQKGMANAVELIAMEISHFCYIATINFDSIMVSGIDKDELVKLVDAAIVKCGVPFQYKMASGSTYFEAQGNC